MVAITSDWHLKVRPMREKNRGNRMMILQVLDVQLMEPERDICTNPQECSPAEAQFTGGNRIRATSENISVLGERVFLEV